MNDKYLRVNTVSNGNFLRGIVPRTISAYYHMRCCFRPKKTMDQELILRVFDPR